MNRQNTLKIKIDLGVALGKHKDEYWSALKDFLNGKIKRVEFEFLIGQYLSKSNIALHNQFIKALFFNSQALVPPPQKYDFRGGARKVSRHEIKLKERIMSLLSPDEIEKLKLHQQNRKNISLQPAQPVNITMSSLSEERRELPDVKVINSLIESAVTDQGLKKSEESCVQILQYALSCYIKNIVSKASILTGCNENLTLQDLKLSMQIDRNLIIPKISVHNFIHY